MNEVGFPNVQRVLNKTSVELSHAQVMRLWQKKPMIFYRDALDVKLDSWQEDCVERYMNHQRLAMVACKGPGKTFLLAMLGWHFFITSFQPKIAALSISKDHLMSNLWAELLMWRSRSPLLEKSTNDGMSRITLKGVAEKFSFIDARSYAKTADAHQMQSTLAGLHADNVGFLIDEAGSIPDAILNTADAALSTEESNTKRARLLVAANPENPSGLIYRASKGNTEQDWAVYNITGDPDDPKRAPKVSIKWAREQIAQYGKDDPWVLVNVFGQYPSVATDHLLSEDEVMQAMSRTIKQAEVQSMQPRMGVDVARGGVDHSAIARRQGLKCFPFEMAPSDLNGPQLAGKVNFLADEMRVEKVYVDNTGGYGGSVMDSLAMFPHLDVVGVVYNSKAQDSLRYFNKRTEMWVRMRDWIRAGGCLPNDPQLKEELLAPKVFFNGGKTRLEEKDQIKQRLGRSPDRADALAQTFADKDQPSYYADFSAPGVPHQPHMNQGRYYASESDIDKYHQAPRNYKS